MFMNISSTPDFAWSCTVLGCLSCLAGVMLLSAAAAAASPTQLSVQSVLWAGFDAQDDAVPTNAVGIHHPHGDVKRISYVNGTCAYPHGRWTP